jgi:hypothetical protein
MKYLLLISFFFCFECFASIQCLSLNDEFSIDLKNDSNGSLQSLKTQDQDGLGTCYANSLSVMLESWAGKPVSYHQLATAYGLDQFFLNKAKKKDGNFFTEGGDSCFAFDAIKKRGQKLCQKKDVLFENLLKSDHQEIYLKKIADFYDALHEKSSSEVKEILTFIKKASHNAKKERVEECRDLEKLKQNAELGLNQLVEKMSENFRAVYGTFTDLHAEVNFSEESIKEFEKFKVQASLLGEHNQTEGKFEISSSVKEKIQQLLLELKTKSYPLKTVEEKNKFFDDMIKEILGDKSQFKDSFRGIVDISNYMGSQEEFNELIVEPILSFSSPDYCLSKEHKRLFKSRIENDLECVEGIDPKISEFLSDIGIILSDNYDDLKLNDGFFEQIEQSDKDMDSFFMGLISKSCEDSGIVIPKDAQCHHVSLPHRVGVVDKIFKSKDDIKKIEKEKTLSLMNSMVYSRLKEDIKGSQSKGRALVVDVCSGFLQKNNVSYNWPKTDKENDCDYNGKHAFHSMAIIGMRCVDGKIQYKIQNSWGTICDDRYPSEVKKHCDPKDGSFWVNESTLADNVTGISLISREKAHYGESF